MGILHVIARELAGVKENVAFNLATIVSPLLFLLAFAAMVAGGITLPVHVSPDRDSSAFLRFVDEYRAPDNTPYLELQDHGAGSPGQGDVNSAEVDEYVVTQEPQQARGGMSGRIVHVVNDVNANMTKNYANRLSGALVGYINEQLDAGTVEVVEQTRYQTDIPWDESFAVSTLVFGAMLAGLLFGQLSMTSEWENNMMGTLALAPCRTSMIVTGKVSAAFLKALVAGGVLVGMIAVVFSAVPQSPWHLTLALALSYVIFASLGVMLGTVVRSPMTAFLISLVCSLCLWVAGGGFGDLSYFGDLAQLVGVANPATYALDIARFAYFGGALEAAALVAMSLGAVITAGGCAFLFSFWIHSEKVAR